ncbi:hypothetical protein Hanom_Chr05g00416791 [Helianthus anomalus]
MNRNNNSIKPGFLLIINHKELQSIQNPNNLQIRPSLCSHENTFTHNCFG